MSWGWPEKHGDLRTGNPKLIAERIAKRIRRANNLLLAVTADRQGRVYVEPPDNAIPDEIVGVYETKRAEKALADQIKDDLWEHKDSHTRKPAEA